MNWYLEVLKKYAVFDGRARRKEFWYFSLFNYLISFVFLVIDWAAGFSDLILGYGPFLLLYTLAVTVPEVAVGARRLHDTNHSGWWLLIWVPIVLYWFQGNGSGSWWPWVLTITAIGTLVLLLWMVRDSDPGENRWGPNPKEEVVPDHG